MKTNTRNSIHIQRTRLQRNAKAGTPNKCKFSSHSMVAKMVLSNEISYLRIRIYDRLSFKSRDVLNTKHIYQDIEDIMTN